ncbi:hypothetical protein ACFL1H_07095 [Nanoarchaeota archaeon]
MSIWERGKSTARLLTRSDIEISDIDKIERSHLLAIKGIKHAIGNGEFEASRLLRTMHRLEGHLNAYQKEVRMGMMMAHGREIGQAFSNAYHATTPLVKALGSSILNRVRADVKATKRDYAKLKKIIEIMKRSAALANKQNEPLTKGEIAASWKKGQCPIPVIAEEVIKMEQDLEDAKNAKAGMSWSKFAQMWGPKIQSWKPALTAWWNRVKNPQIVPQRVKFQETPAQHDIVKESVRCLSYTFQILVALKNIMEFQQRAGVNVQKEGVNLVAMERSIMNLRRDVPLMTRLITREQK